MLLLKDWFEALTSITGCHRYVQMNSDPTDFLDYHLTNLMGWNELDLKWISNSLFTLILIYFSLNSSAIPVIWLQ